MKELEFLDIIKNSLSFKSFIGNDCAFLDEHDLFFTQDTLVEDVHFSLYTTTPYLLGRKAVNVNLSDLAAALAKPEYISISLSLPKMTSNSFVSELYRGINEVCNQYGIKVIGGDITGSDKVVISVCAIGKKVSLYQAARNNAKKGDVILVTGKFGSASAGFHALSNFLYAENSLIDAHLNPVPRLKESSILASKVESDITVMDTSDGLVDALYKISLASKHSVRIDINKVPVADELKQYSLRNNLNYKNFVKWGGEDYELLICVREDIYSLLDENLFKCIGYVENKDNNPSVIIDDLNVSEHITANEFNKNSFNHF